MSNRRPPKARHDLGQTGLCQGKSSKSPSRTARERPDPSDRHRCPADAPALGYADLAERALAAELAAFRELRARLFGDIDVSETRISRNRMRRRSQHHCSSRAVRACASQHRQRRPDRRRDRRRRRDLDAEPEFDHTLTNPRSSGR